MVELVMALVIVAVAGVMAAPRYARAVGRYRTEAAVKRIAADLQYASKLARSTSQEVTVKFEDSKDKNYYYFDNIPSPENEYTVRLWEEPYVAWMYDAPGQLDFDIYGMPKDTKTISVKLGGDIIRTVEIDHTTGEIKVP